jgi:tRNA(Ile)-lysidine synthase
MIEKIFLSAFKKINLNLNPKFLLLVSGGVDSMVLSYLFLKYFPQQFGILHINYQLRGSESDSQQKLVKDFSQKNGINYYIFQVDIPSEKNVQLEARNIRLKKAQDICEKHQYNYIVTAHHKDDVVETFLFRLFRGTGIDGLAGMQILEKNFFKPLLNINKNSIYDYAQKNNIFYLEDSSNFQNKYTRNQLRNIIIPEIEKYFPHFKEKLILLKEDLKQIATFKNEFLKKTPLQVEEKKITFSKKDFLDLPSYFQSELLKTIYSLLNLSPSGIKRINIEKAKEFILKNHEGYFQLPHNLILKKFTIK